MPVSELEADEKRYQMAARDLEAAEALAGLAHHSTLRRDDTGSGDLRWRLGAEAVVTSTGLSQDQPMVPQLFCDSNTNKSHERGDRSAEDIRRQLCSTSNQLKTVSKSRQKLTESEREERKLRRVLANRESARQTIRRRQAMSQELARKVAVALEENEKLKKNETAAVIPFCFGSIKSGEKAKELKLEEKNSLKDASGFLKAQLAKIKKTEPGEKQECTETLLAAKAHFAAMNNQPSLMPCYWPSLFPSPDAYRLQHASSSHVRGSSHFPFPPTLTNQGQDNPVGIIRPGTPILVLPVPCLLPFFTHSSGNHSQDAYPCGKRSCPDAPQPREDNNHSLYNKYPREDASSSKNTMPVAGGSMQQGSLRQNQEQQAKNSEDMLAATEARRRRKELVKLKNINFSHSPRE